MLSSVEASENIDVESGIEQQSFAMDLPTTHQPTQKAGPQAQTPSASPLHRIKWVQRPRDWMINTEAALEEARQLANASIALGDAAIEAEAAASVAAASAASAMQAHSK